MDLGAALSYWIEAGDPPEFRTTAMGPTAAPGMWTRRRLLEEYVERTGRPVPNPLFYYVFGLFRLAGIIQQIYARYVRGHTRDARFATMNQVVATLGRRAAYVAERETI